jgi:hypothetical protein
MDHDQVAATWSGLEDLVATEYVRQAYEDIVVHKPDDYFDSAYEDVERQKNDFGPGRLSRDAAVFIPKRIAAQDLVEAIRDAI